MKQKTLKYIIFLATISIAGVLFIQFIFLKNSYKYTEEQFRESVTVALKEVAWQIMVETGHALNYDSITPVEIISNNTYIVNIDAPFDKEMVKKHLIEELQKHEIYTQFEFAIYNPVTGQTDDKTFITNDQTEIPSIYEFPGNKKYTYYFSIHFPDRSSYFNAQLSIWYFFTILLLIVVLFFGYTLSVIIKQRQLSEVQKNFINNLTHELKTPISSIGLSANVINTPKILETPKRLFEYTRIIQEQNKRLSQNVEKVLNLASLEKSRIHLNLEVVEIISFIKETTEHFNKFDPERKATIKTQFNSSTSYILADKFHFQNLLLNILENAVKYCEQKPLIKIKTSKSKKQLLLSITDNGIGIPKEHRKKIFKKFYRVPTGNVHNVKGFGLGLDYVYKIIKAHHWKIRVDENSTGGSIFTVTIPVKR